MTVESLFLGEFSGVDAAWRGMVRQITSTGTSVSGSLDPLSVGSTFGTCPRTFRELIGVSLVIRNPRNRLTQSRVRRLNRGYLLANVIWAAAGSDDLAWIAFYNPRGRDFSEDHVTLPAAIGKRIFRSPQGDQFAASAALLSSDPTTRRAVISVFTAEDNGSVHRDCSCVLSIQFLLRGGNLDCIVCMRSQSAVMVFPYDAFLLTMLHEAMAVQVGVRLGRLILQYGSLHYYDDEVEPAIRVLDEHPLSPLSMPPMQMPLSVAVGALNDAESEIRHRGRFTHCHGLDSYWNTYLTALHHAVKTRGAMPAADLPEGLSSSWYASIQ